MKSVRLVSNFWLALSSSRRSLLSTRAVSASSTLTTMAMTIRELEGNDDKTCGTGKADVSFVAALDKISKYHPIIVEGMGYYDPRDPSVVASSIVASIQQQQPLLASQEKPLLVITQGDPASPKGISAITPLVAKALSNGDRGLVCLDDSIASYHSRDADRTNVVAEIRYSQLVDVLQQQQQQQHNDSKLLSNLEKAVDAHIEKQNRARAQVGKPPVKDYFKTFAMLQEVTKAGLKQVCGGSIAVAHTSAEINPFSVTSFYEVGLELGLYEDHEIVAYNQKAEETALDFETIDPR